MSDIRRIRSRREWDEAKGTVRGPGCVKRLLYAIGDWLARHGLKGDNQP